MTMLLTGKAYPLGSNYDGDGVNFALFSAHAEQVVLCLFNEHGQEARYPLSGKSGNVWHGYLPGGKPGQRYGYRVYGVWDPQQGLCFNPDNLLIDPYAKALDTTGLHDHDRRPDPDNTAAITPKSLVVSEAYDWQGDLPLKTDFAKTIIYEAHVKGLSKLHTGIPENIRGSYAALAHSVLIAHLTRLGITAIELLPVQQHLDEPPLQRMGLRNYWGYNVIAPFAVEPRYWSGRIGTTPLSEFRDMVRALHQAGIEVIVDVVFNHTAELGALGPILSLRGIDNKSYYWLDESGQLQNWSGCGNTLKLTAPEVVQWVLDCLRYWVRECHVDGFRFDLGTVLGRTPDFSIEAPLLTALRQDPLLSQVKLISESWDLGHGGYQVGQFPYPFAEWNDGFRDEMRRFWLTGDMNSGAFAYRYSASSGTFQQNGRHPHATVNFLTCHDGFTLIDLVSFNEKHNAQNGEDNRDGSSANWSFNHGYEGLDAPAEIMQQRLKSVKALLATLLLAQGTPMLLAGDELGHSQGGNNNGYCQDNEITWINWPQVNNELLEYVSQLIALRKQIPALGSNQWWQANEAENRTDVRWLNSKGLPLTNKEWQDPIQRILMIELAHDWLVIINASTTTVSFEPPEKQWQNINEIFSQAVWRDESLRWQIADRSVGILTCSQEKKNEN